MNAAMEQYTQAQQLLKDKIEDLEDQSRRNNLRIISLPETFKAESLLDICAIHILEALGLPNKCMAEKAHHIALQQTTVRIQDQYYLSTILLSRGISQMQGVPNRLLYALQKRHSLHTGISSHPSSTIPRRELKFYTPAETESFLQSLSPRSVTADIAQDKAKYGHREQRSLRKDPPMWLKSAYSSGLPHHC